MDATSGHSPTRLLTTDEVADELVVSARTVRRIAATGAIPVVQVGRAVRFRPADIEAYIAAQTRARLEAVA